MSKGSMPLLHTNKATLSRKKAFSEIRPPFVSPDLRVFSFRSGSNGCNPKYLTPALKKVTVQLDCRQPPHLSLCLPDEKTLQHLPLPPPRRRPENVPPSFLARPGGKGVRLVRAGASLLIALSGWTARAAADSPSIVQESRDPALTYERLGTSFVQQGKLDDAHDFFDKGLAIARQLAAEHPLSVRDQRDLSLSYAHLGDLFGQQGKLDEALNSYNKSLGIVQKIASGNPFNAQDQRALSVLYNNLGDILFRQGKHDEAYDSFSKSLVLAQQLASDNPSSVQAQDDWRISCCKLAFLAEKKGDRNAALRFFQQAFSISEKLARRFPEDPRHRLILEDIRKGLHRLRAE